MPLEACAWQTLEAVVAVASGTLAIAAACALVPRPDHVPSVERCWDWHVPEVVQRPSGVAVVLSDCAVVLQFPRRQVSAKASYQEDCWALLVPQARLLVQPVIECCSSVEVEQDSAPKAVHFALRWTASTRRRQW